MKATFEARVPDGAAPAVLDGMADIWCRAERWLYRRVFERGGNINAARRECRVRFGLTARQVSSAWFDLRARVAAAKAGQKRHASTRGSRSAAFGRLAPAADLTGGGRSMGIAGRPSAEGLARLQWHQEHAGTREWLPAWVEDGLHDDLRAGWIDGPASGAAWLSSDAWRLTSAGREALVADRKRGAAPRR